MCRSRILLRECPPLDAVHVLVCTNIDNRWPVRSMEFEGLQAPALLSDAMQQEATRCDLIGLSERNCSCLDFEKVVCGREESVRSVHHTQHSKEQATD